VKPGQGLAAEQVFCGPFRKAITAQDGFRDVQFLRSDDAESYVLSIAFESQALQQKWVATDLHGQVWSEMEQHFSGYSLATFTAV
jgi:heme-degrading monooxygenase HmoA